MPKARRGRGEGSISKRPDGLWTAQISLGYDGEGKRIRKTVYGKTKKEVQQKILQLQQDALTGIPIKQDKITIDQHFQDWFRAKKPNLKATTYDGYVRLYTTHIKPVFGGLQVKALDYRRINAFYELLDEKGLSKRTTAYIAFILNSGLEDAVKKGIIQTNPAKLASRRSQEKKEARFLNQDELRLFLNAIVGERLEDAYILALYTGLRPGEWLGLSWDAVDWKGKKITVKQSLKELSGQVFLGEVKTNAGRRTISIPPVVIEALKRRKKQQLEDQLVAGENWDNEHNLIFTTRAGKPLRRTGIAKREWKRVLLKMVEMKLGRPLTKEERKEPGNIIRQAGLEEVTFHTLRHTHASILIFQGVDPKTISKRLGHTNIAFTLQVYGHLFPGQDERAADKTEAFLKTL